MSNNEEMLKKVEKLIPEYYGPSYKNETVNFINGVTEFYVANADYFTELFNNLVSTKLKQYKLWLLNTLIQVITRNYQALKNSGKNNIFRQYLINIFSLDFSQVFDEIFVIKKYCELFNSFIFYDFPENNNTIFNDILANIYETKEINTKINKLYLLLEIFHTFNEEFIQFRHTYSEMQITRSNTIKDYMRANTIKNLLIILHDILKNEEYLPNDKKIIQKSIEIISQLIDWIPFEYFYEVLNIIIGNLIKKYKYYESCCCVLYSIIKKGMEPKLKRTILDQIQINELLNNLLSNKKIDEQILKKISEIINLIGLFIIENFDYTQELIKSNNNNGNEEIIDSFNWSCNELRYYFYFFKEISYFNNRINYEECFALCDSLNSIILYFKSNSIILSKNNYVLDSFKDIFPLIEKILRMPEDYSLDTDIDELDKDDDFFKCRAELSNIYKNTYNISIMKEFIIDCVLNNLGNLLKINNEQDMNNININLLNKYDIEFCLYLISILQEGFIGNDFKRSDNIGNKLNKIYIILFSYPFTKIKKADFVLLSYYNTINKGLENIKNNKDAIEYVIKLYISEEGIFNNGKNFFLIKIVNSFDRFLSKIKMSLQKMDNINFINITNTLKEYLYKLITVIKNSKNFQMLKNYSLLFHSYGLILSLEKSANNKKILYEDSLKLLTNIFNELNTDNFQLNQAICEVILDCIIQFIQAIQNKNKKSTDDIKDIFINFFDNFIGSYCINIIDSKNNSLLLKYISFMQRILILLGVNSLKYLEYFFLSDNCCNLNILTDILKLEQNIITLLKKDSKILVKKTFNNFYNIVQKFNFPNDNISDENKNLINIFLEFNRTFSIINLEIPEVFFENGGIDNLYFLNLVNFVLITGNKFLEDNQRRAVVRGIKFLCNYLIKNTTFFETQQNFSEIINIILNNLFLVYKKNDRKNVIDMSSTVEIAGCHLLFIDFGNLYYNYLAKYLKQNEIEQFVNLIKNVDYKKIKTSDELLNAFDHIVNNFFK